MDLSRAQAPGILFFLLRIWMEVRYAAVEWDSIFDVARDWLRRLDGDRCRVNDA